MEKAKIAFTTGLVLEVLVNGTSFITDTKPEFPEDLSAVTIEDANGVRNVENAKIIECASIDGKYWFAIGQKSEMELWKEDIENALCDLSRE